MSRDWQNELVGIEHPPAPILPTEDQIKQIIWAWVDPRMKLTQEQAGLVAAWYQVTIQPLPFHREYDLSYANCLSIRRLL